jgi:dipeptidase E
LPDPATPGQIRGMRLLLLSNSKNVGQQYLEHAAGTIRDFLQGVGTVLFVPYAGVRVSWDDFTATVRGKFAEFGVGVTGIHTAPDPVAAVRGAEAVVVGGGNTFHLLKTMHERGLVGAIAERVRAGAPFVGWSAGSNVACPTIRTTNDMPVVQPPTLDAMGLVPFQINPHYLDTHPAGHGGETREERILEFLEANPGMTVVGLREGSILRREGGRLTLLGAKPARIFLKGTAAREIEPGDVSDLLRP